MFPKVSPSEVAQAEMVGVGASTAARIG